MSEPLPPTDDSNIENSRASSQANSGSSVSQSTDSASEVNKDTESVHSNTSQKPSEKEVRIDDLQIPAFSIPEVRQIPPPAGVPDITRTFFLRSGAFFLVVSGLALGAIIYRITFVAFPKASPNNLRSDVSGLILSFDPELVYLCLLVIVALIAWLIGFLLFRSVGAFQKQVIPTQDYELLSGFLNNGKTGAVDQYIRLSSLTGVTGLFTKIGLSGLPLATIALTMFFTLLSFWLPAMFDLAKLTLGVFLGAYVQQTASDRGEKSS